jgi:hypothetical protein
VYLFRIAEVLDIDLIAASPIKVELNAQSNYDKAKGKCYHTDNFNQIN